MSNQEMYAASKLARVRPYAILAMIAAAGGALSAAIFWTAYAWERRLAENVFESMADARYRAVANMFDDTARLLEFTDNVFMVGPKADSPEFTNYVRLVKAFLGNDFSRHPELRGMVWAPRVGAAERADYEKTAQAVFDPGFHLMEAGNQREDSFPSYLRIGTVPADERPGEDLSANPAVWKAMQRARDTGEAVALAPITLSTDAKDHLGYRVLLPLYRGGDPKDAAARRQAHAGFLCVDLDIGALVGNAIHKLRPASVNVWINDETEGKSVTLCRYTSRLDPPAGDGAPQANTDQLLSQQKMQLFGRDISIHFGSSASFWSLHPIWQPWVLLCAGLALTTAALVYHLAHIFRADAIQQAVAKRMAAFQQDAPR